MTLINTSGAAHHDIQWWVGHWPITIFNFHFRTRSSLRRLSSWLLWSDSWQETDGHWYPKKVINHHPSWHWIPNFDVTEIDCEITRLNCRWWCSDRIKELCSFTVDSTVWLYALRSPFWPFLRLRAISGKLDLQKLSGGRWRIRNWLIPLNQLRMTYLNCLFQDHHHWCCLPT